MASGPSAAGFPFESLDESISVLCVNAAINYAPRCDYWFTLDPSPENLRIMENQKAGTRYFASVVVPKVKLVPKGVHVMQRQGLPRTRSRLDPKTATPQHWFERWGCIAKMSDDARFVYTGNSAWGALQLARLLGAKKVLLVGVDATEEAKIDGQKPNNLSHLPLLFKAAVGKIEFANAGKMRVNGIENFNHKEGVAWLKK